MASIRLELELDPADQRDVEIFEAIARAYGRKEPANGGRAPAAAPAPEEPNGSPLATFRLPNSLTTGQALLLRFLDEAAPQALSRDQLARKMSRDMTGVGRAGGSLLRLGLIEPRVPGSTEWRITEGGKVALRQVRVRARSSDRDGPPLPEEVDGE